METLHYNFSTSCMLCYKFLDTKLLKKRLPDDDFAYFSSCTKFLSSEDLGENFSKEWSHQCPLLFCQKCLVCVQELSRLNSTLERIQNEIHRFVHKFRLSFLQDRGNNILEQEASRSESEHQSLSGGENNFIHEWPNNISEDNPIQITNCNNEESAAGEHHVLDEDYNDNTGNYDASNEYVGSQNDFDGEVPETTVKVENEEFFEPDEPQSPSFQFCDYETGNDGDLVEQKPDVTKSIVLKQVESKNVSKRRIQKKGNKILNENIESLEDRTRSLRKSLPRRAALKAAKLFASLSNDDDKIDDDVEDDAKSDISEESSFDSDSNAESTSTKKKRSTSSGSLSIKCKYCKLGFSTAPELEAHIPSHDEERPFACDKCDFRFTTERFLRVHNWKHFDEKCFKCGHCENAYKYMHCLKDHVKKQGHHKGSKRNCNLCDVAIAKGQEFILKRKKESGFLPHEGTAQRKSKPKYQNIQLIKEKQNKETKAISQETSCVSDNTAEPTATPKKTSGNILKCKYCKLVFPTTSELEVHISSHDEERPFACDKCDIRFTTERFLRVHKWKHFDEKIFKCGHCENTYKYMHCLKDHVKKQGHHKSSENCSVCDDAIAKGQELLVKKKMENGFVPLTERMPREKKWKPKKPSSRKYSCAECNRNFRDKMDVLYHSYTHQPPGTEVKCNKCDEAFTNVLSHKKHNASVHRKSVPRDEKPKGRQCPICGIVLKGHLNQHMVRHSAIKKFPCPTCGKTFKTKSYLGIHMLYHQDRPYLCEECGKGFHRGNKLRQHYRIHTGNLIFCPHCPKGFTTNTHLKQHLRVHNKDARNVNQASENSIQEMNY